MIRGWGHAVVGSRPTAKYLGRLILEDFAMNLNYS